MRIDAHQHFWRYDPLRHDWITDEMQAIRRDFLPADLSPLLLENGFTGCVAVQVDQSESETSFLVDLAAKNNFIKGVVGWVDLRAGNLEERLDHFSHLKILKGFRHIVQSEKEDDFLLRKDFCSGIERLAAHGFTYDILVYPRHLPFVITFLKTFPEQKFIIDHLSKPEIKKREIDSWKKNMQQIATHKNVYCKLSGMVTEANAKGWKYEDLVPYLDVVVNSFGTGRVVYGSDWPVCLLAATYKDQLLPYQRYFKDFSAREKEDVFGNNACEFYNLL